MQKLRVVALFFFILMLLPFNRSAAQSCTSSTNEWLQEGTRSFSVIYPANDPALGETILAVFGEALDREYVDFATLFSASLDLPITIRVYPSQQDYYCLNTLAPAVSIYATHGHIGTKEIAIFTDSITARPDSWATEGINAFRYELGALFVEKLSGGKAPPGLIYGVGQYLQEPNVMWAQNGGDQYGPDDLPKGQPPQTWRNLWEHADPVRNPQHMIPIGSITSYLIDVYGWPMLLDFFNALPTAEGYRSALFETYNQEFGVLDDHWELYYPAYMGGRWRANDIYGYDLTVFEQLIEAGAYSDANEGLEEAITFLLERGENEKALEAELLNATALAGVEGTAFARQARQALVEGDYPAAVSFAAEAQNRFDQIGKTDREEEIATYAAIAQEIIDLRTELGEIEGQINPASAESFRARLIEIGSRLSELSDQEGRDRAQAALNRIVSLRENTILIGVMAVAVVCAALVAWRISLTRRPPPPELLSSDGVRIGG